jgi:hypothetical protein
VDIRWSSLAFSVSERSRDEIRRTDSDFFRQPDHVVRAPADGTGTDDILKHCGKGRVFQSPFAQAVLNDHQVDLLFSQRRAKIVVGIRVHSDERDDKSVMDIFEAVSDVIGNELFDVLAHGNKPGDTAA